MEKIIIKILEYAIDAPSGNNSQPWKFMIEGNKVHIYNIPERDQTPYNFQQKGSNIAHGTLSENIIISASKMGYRAEIQLFPESNQLDHVAIVTFEKTEPVNEPLYGCIPLRATNRRLYNADCLNSKHKDLILKISQEIAEVELKLIEDRERMRPLAQAVGLHERLIFENKMIHHIVFSRILWSEKEANKKRLGLYLKTKFPDLPSPLMFIMKPFRNWNFVQALNKIGFSENTHKKSIEACLSSSAIGALLIKNDSKEFYFKAGRLFQRIWLTATRLGISIQPMTGIPYLAKRISAGESNGFSPEQIELIKMADSTVKEIFDAGDKTIVMIFRIGYGSEPPHSPKLPPEIISCI